MKKISVLVVLAATTIGLSTTGCSSEQGTVSTDQALDAFQNPTGSFTKDNGNSAFSGYRSEKSESGKVATPGASSSSGTKTQSLRLLSHTLDAKSQCVEGASCACEKSGSFVYSIEQTKLGSGYHFEFDKCVNADGSGFDGKALLVATSQSILGIQDSGSQSAEPSQSSASDSTSDTGSSMGLEEADSSSSTPAADGSKNILFAAKGTASQGSQSLAVEFALVQEAGYTLLAIDVADGKIVIGVAANGNAFVKAKQGTWICKPGSAKGYTCKSTSGAEDVAVDDSDSTSAESTTDAPSAASDSAADTSSSDGF